MSASDTLARPATTSAHEAYYVQRTLRMLEILAFQPCTATQLATVLGVHPRTIRRMLQQFVAEDWAIHESATHRYRLNAHLPSVGFQASRHSRLVNRALPALGALAERVRLSAQLFVPSYTEAVAIAVAEPDGAATAYLGDAQPHHCSAPGRAMLAYRDSWIEAVLAGTLEAHTDRTTTDPERFAEIVAEIRERGWALESGETRVGTASLAAPVWDSDRVVAAVSVTVCDTSGVLDLADMADEVVHTAKTIGEAMTTQHASPSHGVSAS